MKTIMSFLRNYRFVIVLLSALLYPIRALAIPESPDWLLALAAKPVPLEKSAAPAWVLLDETTTEVDAKGEATILRRCAIRLCRNSANSFANGWIYYNGKSDHVLSTKAWLLRGKETIKEKTGSDWDDRWAASSGAVIDESRKKTIDLSAFAVSGDVFGFETRVREPFLVAQAWNYFGWDIPVVEDRFNLILPQGFSIKTFTDGYHSVVAEAAPERGTWSWVLRDPLYTPQEPLIASSAQVDARVLVQINPPTGAEKEFTPRTFTNWGDVADWLQALNANQCDQSPELVARVRELTAGLTDQVVKIRALGRYVQKTRYIGINEDLNAGHGMQPRKASLVFSRGYGDCKDKANLLRAMLREIGVTSYLVSAMTERKYRVREDCASPGQFNHAILAIAVDDSVHFPSVVSTEKWGHLLFFDPTSEYTILGDLPEAIQGSKAHIQTEGSDALITLPVMPVQEDLALKRQVRLRLAESGDVQVEGSVAAYRQAGARLRREIEAANLPQELEKLVGKQLSDSFRGAAVLEKKTEDDLVAGRCALVFKCTQKRFAQSLPGNITVVKLDVLSRHLLPAFPEKVRYRPIDLPPLVINDEVVFELPPDQAVEELPASTKLDSPYGNYALTSSVEQGTVVLRRTITFNKVTVPVDDYEKLKKFLSDIARADRSSVLLKHRT